MRRDETNHPVPWVAEPELSADGLALCGAALPHSHSRTTLPFVRILQNPRERRKLQLSCDITLIQGTERTLYIMRYSDLRILARPRLIRI